VAIPRPFWSRSGNPDSCGRNRVRIATEAAADRYAAAPDETIVILAGRHYIAIAKSASRTAPSGDVATQARIAGQFTTAIRAAAPGGANWLNPKPGVLSCAMKQNPERK